MDAQTPRRIRVKGWVNSETPLRAPPPEGAMEAARRVWFKLKGIWPDDQATIAHAIAAAREAERQKYAAVGRLIRDGNGLSKSESIVEIDCGNPDEANELYERLGEIAALDGAHR